MEITSGECYNRELTKDLKTKTLASGLVSQGHDQELNTWFSRWRPRSWHLSSGHLPGKSVPLSFEASFLEHGFVLKTAVKTEVVKYWNCLLISSKSSQLGLQLLCKDGDAFSFVFEVKFYPPDVTSLQEDITRFVTTYQMGNICASSVVVTIVGSYDLSISVLC